jgi:hypothetical protein
VTTRTQRSRPLSLSSSFAETERSRTFTSNQSNWGFPQFAPLDKIVNPANGFLVNDRLILSIDLDVESKGPFQLDTGMQFQLRCQMRAPAQVLNH